MKRIFILLSFVFIYGCSSTEQITKLENRVGVLENQLQSLGDELSNIKNDNELLRNLNELNKKVPIPNNPAPQQPEQTKTESKTGSTQCKAITKAGTQCKRNAQAGTDYCWQHQGNAAQKSSVSPSASSDKTIITGPRGGQYYINKNGKKT